ncbi:MAG: cytochrome c oxidase assembly protein [Candidatus Methylomirabilales bacterium]
MKWRGILLCLIGLTFATAALSAERTPEETVRRYIHAVYSRNYADAYPLISDADKKYKSREEYLRENVSFAGPARELAAQLASYIEYENPRAAIEGDQATVVLRLKLPDGNDPKLRELLLNFDEERLRVLPEVERQTLQEKLAQMHQRGGVPVIVGQERFELVNEVDGWKLFLNWGGAVLVRFAGDVKMELPWQFEPVQIKVRALPGETLRAAYRVKNLSDTPVTGKARHIILPKEEYVEILQCFCFIQQTLDPGEERELLLLFRVKWDMPAEVQVIQVRYEFYPPEHFKPEWEKEARQ